MLALVQLSVQRGSSLLIRLPGGSPSSAAGGCDDRGRLLDVPASELARVSGADPPQGPVALVTARIIRRGELDRLDASSVPVAPALHPHRLRGDGLMSPVRGGRPRLVTGAARLLFAAPVTGFPVILGVAPRVVVIDAAGEAECDWLVLARSWARRMAARSSRSPICTKRGALASRAWHTPPGPRSRPLALQNRPRRVITRTSGSPTGPGCTGQTPLHGRPGDISRRRLATYPGPGQGTSAPAHCRGPGPVRPGRSPATARPAPRPDGRARRGRYAGQPASPAC